MLHIVNIAVSYNASPVLNDISFQLQRGERAGLVGTNGVGKSTLLKVIVGVVSPDAGTVRVPDGVDVGYLPQELPIDDGKCIQDWLDDALAHLRGLATTMRRLEAKMAEPDADLDALFERYDAATAAFETSDGYEMDARTDTVMSGLGVGHLPRDRALATLSGGERARVGLAAMLARSPGVLLLDEPTNHLDAEALTWLEGYLADYRGAVLVVSHDRVFLNRTVTRIIEIDEHIREAVSYSGDYDAYATEKMQHVERWRADYAEQQDEIKQLRRALKGKQAHPNKRNIQTSDGDKFIKHFKDQTADKSQARDVNALEERLRRIEADPIPQPPKPLDISPDLDPAELRGSFPVSLRGVQKRYGETVILRDVTVSVGAGERLTITGANGAGKSTLLRLIVGHEQPDAGEVTLASSARLGYLPQVDELPPGETLIEVYGYGLPGDYETHKADLISSGFFTYPQLSTPVSGMSAGQRRKVQLARLIAQRANVLLLDEPTNHLSLDVLEAFEKALDDFPGTVIAVSHDRRFLERFGGARLRLTAGRQPMQTN